MTDAQEEIKGNLTVITPEIQNRKRDEDRDSCAKEQNSVRDSLTMHRKDQRDFHQVLGP